MKLSDQALRRIANAQKKATQDNEVWDRYGRAKELLGADALIEELVMAMSTEEALENIEFIERMHDFGSLGEDY